jgi:hypothetical protein
VRWTVGGDDKNVSSFGPECHVLGASGFSDWFDRKIVPGQEVHDCRQLTFALVAPSLNSTNALQRWSIHVGLIARLLYKPVGAVVGNPEGKHGDVTRSRHSNRGVIRCGRTQRSFHDGLHLLKLL